MQQLELTIRRWTLDSCTLVEQALDPRRLGADAPSDPLPQLTPHRFSAPLPRHRHRSLLWTPHGHEEPEIRSIGISMSARIGSIMQSIVRQVIDINHQLCCAPLTDQPRHAAFRRHVKLGHDGGKRTLSAIPRVQNADNRRH